MELLADMTWLLAFSEAGAVQTWMQHALYPVLFSILVIASLGLPIPEDIPLIAAGVLLKTHPGIGTWTGTILVGLTGIMIGDLVLYTMGKRFGPDVVRHRFVKWFITPARFRKGAAQFHLYGVWFCFFGRFFMGIRAVMCITAGATRYPYWKFFLADFSGAVLSVPFFIWLGYWFAGMIPTLRAYMGNVQLVIGAAIVLGIAIFMHFEIHRRRKSRERMQLRLARRQQARAARRPTNLGSKLESPQTQRAVPMPTAASEPTGRPQKVSAKA